MKEISKKAKEFNDYRFEGLNWRQYSTKYMTMNRVSTDENKIVVRISGEHLLQTRYGYALILDNTHVVFVKNWQVSINAYGKEVLLTREYFDVKEWGQHDEFDEEPQNLKFDEWLEVAKAQDNNIDQDGEKMCKVRWAV